MLDFARHLLRSLTTDTSRSCSTCAPIVAIVRGASLSFSRTRGAPIELLHLADCSPSCKALRASPGGACSGRGTAIAIILQASSWATPSFLAEARARGLIPFPVSYQMHCIGVSPLRAGQSRPTTIRCLSAKVCCSFRPTRAVAPGAPSGGRATRPARRQNHSHKVPPLSTRCSRSSSSIWKSERLRPKGAPSPLSACRERPRRSRLTGTEPSFEEPLPAYHQGHPFPMSACLDCAPRRTARSECGEGLRPPCMVCGLV